MTGTPAVRASSLVKNFGRRGAVAGVDLTLSAGDVLALFGPNGAGKTTLLRLLAGLLRPSAGEVRIHGADARTDTATRARIGLISHQTMLYGPLTALENVEFAARLYGVRDPRGAARTALDGMRVLDRADLPVRALSRGMQQRVSIARATVHDPAVILLDEPFSGLDEAGARTLTGLLQGLAARGATLALVTHNLAEGLALATHAAIMAHGRFVRFDRRADARAFDAQRYSTEYTDLVAGA